MLKTFGELFKKRNITVFTVKSAYGKWVYNKKALLPLTFCKPTTNKANKGPFDYIEQYLKLLGDGVVGTGLTQLILLIFVFHGP